MGIDLRTEGLVQNSDGAGVVLSVPDEPSGPIMTLLIRLM
jgi:hypothetical protein